MDRQAEITTYNEVKYAITSMNKTRCGRRHAESFWGWIQWATDLFNSIVLLIMWHYGKPSNPFKREKMDVKTTTKYKKIKINDITTS